jgi:hypothetical protein
MHGVIVWIELLDCGAGQVGWGVSFIQCALEDGAQWLRRFSSSVEKVVHLRSILAVAEIIDGALITKIGLVLKTEWRNSIPALSKMSGRIFLNSSVGSESPLDGNIESNM